MPATTRRIFIGASSAALFAPVATPAAAAALLRRIDGGPPASFPSHDPEVVREVVGKSHTDYETVNEIVTRRPALAKAVWDWGFGDWESALGAASHMGRRDIAEVLIAHGARPNLFTFAMLGQVDVVRATCEANPGIQRLRGPHDFSLMHHARIAVRRGHDDAQRVVDYLETLGDADVGRQGEPLGEDAAQPYLGEYEPVGAPGTRFRIAWHERVEVVTFQRDDRQIRFLRYAGEDRFNPSGANDVEIVFEMHGGKAVAHTIRDGDLVVTARRVG